MTLGQRLAALRTEAQLSQEALADQMGVSRQSVSKWETDASIPELDKLIQLSKLFRVTLDELVMNESTRKTHDAVSDSKETVQSEFTDAETDEPAQNGNNAGEQALRLAYRLVGCALIIAAAALFIFTKEYTALMLLFSLFCMICGVMCVVGKLHIVRAILLLTAICLLYLLGKILFSPA